MESTLPVVYHQMTKNSTRFYSENFGKREVIKLDTLWSQVKILKELTNTNANS